MVREQYTGIFATVQTNLETDFLRTRSRLTFPAPGFIRPAPRNPNDGTAAPVPVAATPTNLLIPAASSPAAQYNTPHAGHFPSSRLRRLPPSAVSSTKHLAPSASKNTNVMPSRQCCSNVASMGKGLPEAKCLCSLLHHPLARSQGVVPQIALGISQKCRIAVSRGFVCQVRRRVHSCVRRGDDHDDGVATHGFDLHAVQEFASQKAELSGSKPEHRRRHVRSKWTENL
uniref:Bifunctional inhibitor/plant lipid transfer protein/seed storage helical domain-containing protein n=1 Tax=Physcomitrium patens TaxID=3218 RepID=A0A7I4D4V8_PHYPA